MPILSYFLVVGSVLTGLLIVFGNEGEQNGPHAATSQQVGIPKFKANPEPEHARATAVNFAAEHRRPDTKRAKAAESPGNQKTTSSEPKPKPLGRFAEFPNYNLKIH
jgi:hypothetical protein